MWFRSLFPVLRYLVVTIFVVHLFQQASTLYRPPLNPYETEAKRKDIDLPDANAIVTPLSRAEQDAWIRTNFKAADPALQEWCTSALLEGTHWGSAKYDGGAQYSQDSFLARNVFFESWVRKNRKGFYVEAGANNYKHLSSTYFYEKCLGWEGLCVEPQQQYHAELSQHRSCALVPMCLTKERSQMMLGGLPHRRGAGMFVRPLPPDGKLPVNETTHKGQPIHWELIECAPLGEILRKFAPGRTHVDHFVLDVEGAEMTVLDTIEWGGNAVDSDSRAGISFAALQIEVEHMVAKTKEKLTNDMLERGYERAHDLGIDFIFVPKKGHGQATMGLGDHPVVWTPKHLRGKHGS